MNGQSATNNLSNEQVQVLLTGKFGDGAFVSNSKTTGNNNYCYITNCLHREYIEYKRTLLGDLVNTNIKEYINKGFKASTMYSIYTKCSPIITSIACESLEDSLKKIDELGLALWIYDDGSLHKNKNFYNLNTQKYSKEINMDLFCPYLKSKFNITATPTIERKRDGREFWYLRISKYEGAFIISKILSKFFVPCYNYKIISSETILKWSKLQEKLKSTNNDINTYSNKQLGQLLKSISL